MDNGKERCGNGKADARVRVRLGARKIVVKIWISKNVRIFTLGFLKAVDTKWQGFDKRLELFIFSNANEGFDVSYLIYKRIYILSCAYIHTHIYICIWQTTHAISILTHMIIGYDRCGQ